MWEYTWPGSPVCGVRTLTNAVQWGLSLPQSTDNKEGEQPIWNWGEAGALFEV